MADTAKNRAIRVSDELWSKAQSVAASKSETVSEVVRRALENYSASGGLVRSAHDLSAWLAGHPHRHERLDDRQCSCGWRLDDPRSDVRWLDHFNESLLGDLGDVLESDTVGESWRSLAKDLYLTIDIYNERCTCDFEWPDA